MKVFLKRLQLELFENQFTVLWPKPKQRIMIRFSDDDDDDNITYKHFHNHPNKMGKVKNHNTMYRIFDKWDYTKTIKNYITVLQRWTPETHMPYIYMAWRYFCHAAMNHLIEHTIFKTVGWYWMSGIPWVGSHKLCEKYLALRNPSGTRVIVSK